jgi:hypothetical protein
MNILQQSLFATLLICALAAHAEVVVDRLDNEHATPGFKFPHVPLPRRGDAAAKATFTLLDGQPDGNGGSLDKLHDGALPETGDQPSACFFFRPGTDGGRILVDLGSVIELRQIGTYSWHRDTRAPQVYRVYASDGKAADFNPQLHRPADPAQAGWKLLADVDTRPKEGPPGGQYGVNITDPSGSLGAIRYLLFDVSRTEDADPFGNTFFNEIDAIDRSAPDTPEAPLPPPEQHVEAADTKDGAYRFTVDTTDAPDLTDWVHRELVPVIQKWYPLIVKALPGEGYSAPQRFGITFNPNYHGVAATGGTHIDCDPTWYRNNLKTEALGSVVHELVHVVQQYGRARRAGAARPPGWLVEGIPDYLRFYQYEPELHGADIKPRNAARARYDGSYRVSANFLNWVVGKYDPDLIRELNAALREGRYDEELWKTRTGHTLAELGEEWKKTLDPGDPPPS